MKPGKNTRDLFARERKNPSPWKNNKFNPDQEYVDRAVDDYLRNGGKIQRIIVTENDEVGEGIEQTEKLINDFLCDQSPVQFADFL